MSRRVHCIEGPNMAAREAHTVLRFCTRFYDHLPRRAVVFLQDDPEVDHLRRAGVGTPHFLERLEEHYMERWRASKAPATSNGTDSPWELQPCPCHVDRERNIDEEHYGHWRTISWWLRTFLRRPDGALHLPPRLAWPRHAQFAVPSLAIRHRSRDFFAMNLALTSLPSPHKAKRLRAPGEAERECTQWRQRRGVRSCVQTRYERHTKWANFGGYVVDLGPLPSVRGADNKPAAHGMALAEMYERLWFALFDPMLHEAAPQVPECFTTEAVEAGPIRCGGACPATLDEQRRAQNVHTEQHLATRPIQQRIASWKLRRVRDPARAESRVASFMGACAEHDRFSLPAKVETMPA
ncbi:hypothetical protein AB1Y20_001527 [Prymnesium parvum]|uniref:Uncharacterized protein n=1 Tax=Prymnesium parvum TaxID=97485 RepID=A0AB34KBM6_PRYPA